MNKDFDIIRLIQIFLLFLGIFGIFCIFLSIYGGISFIQYTQACENQNGKFYNYDKCIKIEDGEAVRYGMVKIDKKILLYKWASTNGDN